MATDIYVLRYSPSKRGYEIYLKASVGGDKYVGFSSGKRLSLSIPAVDYCERHGVDLCRLKHREVKVRGNTAYRTFEITAN